MARIVSQLISELDSIPEGVFVIGATNRPDLIDGGLLRPGRFEKLLYLGIADSHESVLKVLAALTRNFNFGCSVDLKAISTNFESIYTGADMYALCADAYLNALTRCISQRKTMDAVVVEHDDFEKAANELTPSVGRSELLRYENLRKGFETNDGLESLRDRKGKSSLVNL